MKKVITIISICVAMGFLLSACSGINKKISESKDKVNEAETMSAAETVSAAETMDSAETGLAPAETLQTSSAHEYESEANAAAAGDIVFEGRYFDESVYQYMDIPESESPLIYCEIIVSNVTDTSFDFIIYEKVMATGESEIIIPANTAVFIEDGTRAAYYGDEQTLYFAFPDEQELYPKHIEIKGIERMEGKVYMNNSIPGHESG